MAQILVRQLPNEVHRALKTKAAQLGKSAESVAREILTLNLMPDDRSRLGDQLTHIWDGSDLAEVTFDRDTRPYQPMSFE